MRTVLVLILIALSGCATYREPSFVTQEELAAREARIQCRVLARNLIQLARCDGR